MSERVVLIDAVRSPFGKAGSLYSETRADDIMVRTLRGLLERNPKISPTAIDDVAIAAATQSGDQGMNIGRSVSLLAGIPDSVPGYSIDRWCAGALTAVTTVAGAIAMGQYDIAIAGGVEHMGPRKHPHKATHSIKIRPCRTWCFQRQNPTGRSINEFCNF